MNIENFKEANEQVLWTGKPVKSVYIKEKIFSPFAIVAIIWFLFDVSFISSFMALSGGMNSQFGFMFIPFMFFHLGPLWIYLGQILFAVKAWQNMEFMVTDKAIYHLSGVFTTNCQRKTFQEVTNVSFHQGIIDKRYNVGDVFISTGQVCTNNGHIRNIGINIIDIEDYMGVYKLISKTGRDIFSDTMYPNDLRPKENHGYKTDYKPNNLD